MDIRSSRSPSPGVGADANKDFRSGGSVEMAVTIHDARAQPEAAPVERPGARPDLRELQTRLTALREELVQVQQHLRRLDRVAYHAGEVRRLEQRACMVFVTSLAISVVPYLAAGAVALALPHDPVSESAPDWLTPGSVTALSGGPLGFCGGIAYNFRYSRQLEFHRAGARSEGDRSLLDWRRRQLVRRIADLEADMTRPLLSAARPQLPDVLIDRIMTFLH